MTEIEIKLNDGTTLNMEIEEYSAVDIADKINNTSVQAIVIGDAVLQRFSIVQIVLKREVIDNE